MFIVLNPKEFRRLLRYPRDDLDMAITGRPFRSLNTHPSIVSKRVQMTKYFEHIDSMEHTNHISHISLTVTFIHLSDLMHYLKT